MASDDPIPRRPGRIRSALLLSASMFMAGAVAILGLAGWDAWRVMREVRAGESIAASLDVTDLETPGDMARRLDRARARFDSAAARASGSRWFGILSRVPFAGAQVETLRDLAAATVDVADIGSEATTELEAVLEESHASGAERLAMLDRLQLLLTETSNRLAAVTVPRRGLVFAPASGIRDEFDDRLEALTEDVGTAGDALRDVRDLLAGPTRYVVVAANNAEMRGVGGMALQAGVLDFESGGFEARAFHPTEDLFLDEPVELPPAMDALYGWLDPGQEWRNTGSSPHFPRVAAVHAAMAERLGSGRVDGVVHADVVALREILGAVGPVEVRGVRFTEATVETLVLSELYERFDDRPEARRRILGELARAAFAALDRRAVEARDLLAALVGASRGRHLMLWSREDALQRTWATFGVAGGIDPNGLLIAVQNHGGNKLDPYLDVSADVEHSLGFDRRHHVGLRIQLVNSAPSGLPAYVEGDGTRGLQRGDHRVFVTVDLPAVAHHVRVEGAELAVAGEDPPMRVVGTRFDVPRGSEREITVEFWLPAGHAPLRLIPSGRVEPVRLLVDGEVVTDDRRRDLRL